MTYKSDKPQPREDIVKIMVDKFNGFTDTDGFKKYKIRELVEDTAKLGKKLARVEKLKTNQIRKFLDAVNRLKSQLAKDPNKDFATIESELVFLRPKLAYAAARQRKDDKDLGPVEPLKQVLEAAIKKVNDPQDFERLVQLIESIIAYHKDEGGRDQ
jgi:CRISPR-associated protein Csm2